MSITTSTGTTVSLEQRDGDTIVILTNADAPEDMRRAVGGRITEGHFQTPLFMDFALSPEVLHAIATLIDNGDTND